MSETKRKRKIFSIKHELLKKSRESALCAVQIYNNPNVTFKAESFIVLMIIAWTYLLHAFYRGKGIEYRYFRQGNKRRIFEKTKRGSDKYWELEKCLNDNNCPLDKGVITNLMFLIELRHEIEHQMTTRIDEFIGAKLQACCLNYNNALNDLFDYDISHYQPLSIQFFAFSEEQVDSLKNVSNVPKNIIDFVSSFEADLDDDEKLSPQYSYRIIYTRDSVNHEGQADQAIRYIDEGSEEGIDIHNVLIKNKQHIKLTQKQVVQKVNEMGYEEFGTYQHQLLWKSKWPTINDRAEKATKYGETVVHMWLWYEEKWLPIVIEHCSSVYSA